MSELQGAPGAPATSGAVAERALGHESRLLAPRRLGNSTVTFAHPPQVAGVAAVVGPLEGAGPLGQEFDHVYADLYCGQESYELAERTMVLNACYTALQKAGLTPADIDFFVCGDLLNQIMTSSFVAVQLGIPYLGVYGACSTCAEGLAVGAILIDGGFARRVLVATGSHYATAERQYRYPMEYGGQRKPYAQRTVTGAGAAVLTAGGSGPCITHATVGRAMDMGIKDPFNQGAAMAPAAVDTITRHLLDTGRPPEYYDRIVTGDLARFGQEMATELAARNGGFDLSHNYTDCGALIFDPERQDVQSGGSGCGCSAAVLYGHLLKEVDRGHLRRLLLVATGALLSVTSFQQGENIPAVAHGVVIEA